MNINYELNKILKKYNIIKHDTYDEIIRKIRRLETDLNLNDVIGLYGVGIEAIPLLSMLYKYAPDIKIDFCFDQNKTKFDYKNVIKCQEVFKPSQIMEKGITCIFISSKVYAKEMRTTLQNIKYDGEIIDIYTEYHEIISDFFIDYKVLNTDRKRYFSDNKNKEYNIEKVIKDYLVLKDFSSAFIFIDEYIERDYKKKGLYLALKNEIQSLLNKIRERVNSRDSKDIIINWVDAVSFYDIRKINYLEKVREKGTEFLNAYTVMPWTTETTKTIMFGQYPIEGKLYEKNRIPSKEAELLKILKQAGYTFVYCGLPKMSRFYDSDVICPIGLYDTKWSSSIQKQWDAIAYLCENQEPACILIHTLRETHEPFVSGRGETCNWYGSTRKDWELEEMRKQSQEADMYISEQLDFYSNLYGKKSICVYMSDHGRVANSPMDETKIHTMLFITGEEIEKKKIRDMFSLVDFSKIIEKLVKGEQSWSDLARDYVEIENLDAYDSALIKCVIEGRVPREEMCQCRGVVTERDSFFRYADGNKYYFADKCSKVNSIDKMEYQSRICELSKLCGTEFVDIYISDKFKYSKQLYLENS